MAPVCSKCKQKLPVKEHLECSICKNSYDLECANISKYYFNRTMSTKNKNTWRCPACQCKVPKKGNIDTPIRPCDHELNTQQTVSSSPTNMNNIIYRQKSQKPNSLSDTTCSEDLSILGDTIYNNNEDNVISSPNTETKITMENLSDLIITRLKENNTSIITELQNTLQIEIKNAIKKLREEFMSDTVILTKENDERKNDIHKLSREIETLKTEKEKLINELIKLKGKFTNDYHKTENNSKKIVLYGLAEYYRDSQNDMNNRIIALFHDILHMDVSLYIEDTYRIGKYNSKNRPIVIEFISKRIAKYILANKQYFYGTKLYISEHLDQNERKERKHLQEVMQSARKKGHHAVIRNNTLYIEGKEANLEDMYTNEENNRNLENICTSPISNNSQRQNQGQKEPTASKSAKIHTFRKDKCAF
ncbi:hypothetical protein O3G_MSEX006927 [Manduca sexta]|uniref:Zinc finger DNA binding protein n=1 Tax=Manduca sexta TaxID=7130 RepID=A0A921Z407_MANSE|nr:hypothetical protein O3G_MSEX006927 [Manduca sexta]